MDHAAVFVDAGYLLAESARLLTGSPARSNVVAAYPRLIRHLIELAKEHSGLPLLRTYWYDGAPDTVPTPDQLAIGRLPDVKLRLGRKTLHGQKGVDSLIVLDLVTLAQARAMSRAYVLSGDEDIREGVALAQHLGVRVVLVGIPTRDSRSNQADSLVREADERMILDHATAIRPHLSPAPGAPQSVPPAVSIRDLGREFGEEWLRLASADQAVALRERAPTIPRELDVQLVIHAESTLGSLRGREDERRELRAGFWDAIMAGAKQLAALTSA